MLILRVFRLLLALNEQVDSEVKYVVGETKIDDLEENECWSSAYLHGVREFLPSDDTPKVVFGCNHVCDS